MRQPTIEAEIVARKNSRPLCSVCGRPGPKQGTTPVRQFGFIPIWGIKVFFVYALRRLKCPNFGIRVEDVPWASGKHRLSKCLRLLSCRLGQAP